MPATQPAANPTPSPARDRSQENDQALQRCDRCDRQLVGGRLYEVRGPNGPVPLCRRCALIHPSMLARSLRVAVVVGTLLTILNQGDRLLDPGPLASDLWWKVPLTYLVPFCVATYGALANARRD